MKTALFALMILASGIAFGQPPGRHEESAPAPGGRLMKQLNLTEDQQKQFDRMSTDLRKAQIALRAKISTAEVDLHTLFKEDSPDRAKIVAKQKEIHQFMSDLAVNRTDYWFDVNKILTADQQKVWKKYGIMAHQSRGHRFLGMVRDWFGRGRHGGSDSDER